MPHVLKMKDGKLLTPFGIRDLLDAVEDYAGEELRREIEEYIETNVEDIDDYEKEYDRMERDGERLADHQRSVLCNIRDEVDALDALVPFPVSWTVKMKKKQKETQDILSYHTQAAGCSDKARAKASGGRQPIEECGRTGL